MTCKMFLKLLFLILVVVLLGTAFLPDTKTYFGYDVEIVMKDKLKLPETFSGPLLANRLLSQSDHLFLNEIEGPEAFAVWQNQVYTGLADGRIVQILPDSLKTVALIDPQNLGLEQCSKLYNSGKCGRPLGLRFDSKGTLFALDPNFGLFTVDVTTGAVKLFVSKEVLGAVFLDDFVLLEDGKGNYQFYLTDVSTKWNFQEAMAVIAERDQTGRLLRYDSESGKVTVELDKLPFPNGVELTDDRSAILMVSCINRLVYRYTIQENHPSKGKLQVLVDTLPGEPDNIKRSRNPDRETYWVAFFTARNRFNPHLMDEFVDDHPLLFRFGLRFQRLLGFVLEQLASLIRSDCLRELGEEIKSGHFSGKHSAIYGMVLEFDGATGEIVNSLHSPDGHTKGLSEVMELEPTETGRHFYLGSASNKYIGKLDLPKSAFRASNRPKVIPKRETSKLKEEESKKPKVQPKVQIKVEQKSKPLKSQEQTKDEL